MKNTEQIKLKYKPSTIPRLQFYGYHEKEQINRCRIISGYWDIENKINPHKEQDIFFEYIIKIHKERVNLRKKLKGHLEHLDKYSEMYY